MYGYNESFNGKLRDKLLNTEIFYTIKEAQVLIEQWRRHYNEVRPHSARGYRSPAPRAIIVQRDKHRKLCSFCNLKGRPVFWGLTALEL